jgi:hypothetical protein
MEEGRLIALYGLLFAAGYFVMVGIALTLGKLIFPKIEVDDDENSGVNTSPTVRSFPVSKKLTSRSFRGRQHARSLKSLQKRSD